MSSETYEILALKYGEFAQRRRYESFIGADDHDAPHPIDYFVWVVRNANRTIVVDTGFDAAEGAKRGRKVDRAPAAALEQIGVAAAGVDQVDRDPPALRPRRHARAPSPRRASICRPPRWPTRPALACATRTSAIPSRPTTCARW